MHPSRTFAIAEEDERDVHLATRLGLLPVPVVKVMLGTAPARLDVTVTKKRE